MSKNNRSLGCNIYMICLILNWFLCDPSRMLQLSQLGKNGGFKNIIETIGMIQIGW